MILSSGEAQLIDSIIEQNYPDPQEGTELPVESGERRAARGLERKGFVLLGTDEHGSLRMAFTAAGSTFYHQRLDQKATPFTSNISEESSNQDQIGNTVAR